MKQQQLQHLDLGTCGLEPADWSTSYYPDDLPEEWKLAYYANEFLHLFIPAVQWQGHEIEWLEQLAEVEDEQFCFYVEFTGQQLSAANWDKLAQQLREINCAAMVRDEQLAQALHGIVSRVDLLRDNEILLQPLWQAADDDRQLALLHSETALNPLQLRETFEIFQRSAQCRELVVFLDTPYQTAEKIRQMCELYGW